MRLSSLSFDSGCAVTCRVARSAQPAVLFSGGTQDEKKCYMAAGPFQCSNRLWSNRRLHFSLFAALLTVATVVVALMLGEGTAQHKQAPTDSLLHTAVPVKDMELLGRAEQLLISRCMEQHGFRYWPVPVTGPSVKLQPLPYSIPTIAFARSDGFGEVQGKNQNEIYADRLSPKQQASYISTLFGLDEHVPQVTVRLPQGGLVGHSSAGCQAHAEGALYRNFPNWFRLSTTLGQLQSLLQSEVTNDPRFLRVLQRWRRCIEAHGYSWMNPITPISEFTSSPGAVPNGRDIRAALVVSSCANTIGLVRIATMIGAHYSGAILHRYGLEVSLYREIQLSAIPYARDVIRGSGIWRANHVADTKVP